MTKMIKVRDGMWIDATEKGYRVFDGESVFLLPEELSEEDRVMCNAAWADHVLPTVGLAVSAEEALAETAPKITMQDLKSVAHIPTVNGVVEALKGQADIDTVVDASFNTTDPSKEDCFSANDAEKLHAYIRDITAAYAEVIVNTAQKDKISKSPNGEAMQSIRDFGERVHELLVLVDPNDSSATFTEDQGDEHAATAAKLFGTSVEKVTPAQRQAAKAANHSARYTTPIKLDEDNV